MTDGMLDLFQKLQSSLQNLLTRNQCAIFAHSCTHGIVLPIPSRDMLYVFLWKYEHGPISSTRRFNECLRAIQSTSAQILGSRAQIPLGALMCAGRFLCCFVLSCIMALCWGTSSFQKTCRMFEKLRNLRVNSEME